MRIFKKKKKKSVFISEGQPPEVNELGIKSEYNNNLFTKIILLVFALLGFTLCVLDIRDDGMLLKLSFGETEFNYSGSDYTHHFHSIYYGSFQGRKFALESFCGIHLSGTCGVFCIL